MGKKLKDLKWESVALEGLSESAMRDNLEGFVGLEECHEYGMDKENKTSKKKKKPKRKKSKSKSKSQDTTKPTEKSMEPPSKKRKLENGFIVETCTGSKPSITNSLTKPNTTDKNTNKQSVKDKKAKAATIGNKKIKPAKLGDNLPISSGVSVEDMQAWSAFQIPDLILKALAEQGFDKPTQIQELSLPSAMLGRRDILGAAQTGSGKTLAFGIPIISGILKLKERQAAGEDINEVLYKKSSIKKKPNPEPKKQIRNKKRKNVKRKSQDSSEEGYSSDSDNDSSNNDSDSSNNDNDSSKNVKKSSKNDNNSSKKRNNSSKNDKDYLEEYNVPLRKKEASADEGNDSDDENYVHLSEMIDSDDLADSSDDNGSDNDDNEIDNDDNEIDNDDNESDNDDNGSEDEENGDDTANHSHNEDTDSQNEYDDVNGGIGCVKVVDDLALPAAQAGPKSDRPLYALILTPTRELAMQVSRHLITAAKYTGIRIATIVGGMAAVKQERVLSKRPEIVVATPGRLWELYSQGQPHLSSLQYLKFLAIDETDRMVERNHFEELHPLLERMNADEEHRRARQNFVYSATLTMVHDLPDHLKGKKVTKRGKILNRKVHKMTPEQKLKKLIDMIGMTDPKVVDITSQNSGTAESLTECRITCSIEEKDFYLYYILKRHPGRTIVFCNSIGSVKRLAQLFGLLECRPLPLHASMPQRQRLKNLERFRDDPHGVLVATDVAARGLDIHNVDHVIHYQVPRTAENYVHRSGRTARAHKEGLTILIMEPAEAFNYNKLCRTLNKQAELPIFPVPSRLLAPMKSIVSLARDVDRLQLSHKRDTQEQGWLDKAAREMDIIVDEDFVQTRQKDSKLGKQLQNKRKQLENLLSKPVFPKGYSYKYPTLNDADALRVAAGSNALQVMKDAISSGKLKKEKRVSKNAPLLKLGKKLSEDNSSVK